MKYKSDEDKMRVALNEAKKAHDVDEVPIGAAIFDKDDNLICANHNRRELDQNPTCLLYTSPSPRDPKTSRMPSSA